jgi:hypothetical protein
MRIPFHVSVILPTRGKLSAEFHSCEHARLAADGPHELDNPIHAARHIYGVANFDIPAIGAHLVLCCWRLLPCESVEGGLPRDSGVVSKVV